MKTQKQASRRKALKSPRVKIIRPTRDPKKIRAARLLADEIRKELEPLTAGQSLDDVMRQLRGRSWEGETLKSAVESFKQGLREAAQNRLLPIDQLFDEGHGNYSKDRHEWLDNQDLVTIIKRIQERRKTKK